MPSDDDRCYYERRAERELKMASATTDRNACASHYQLANLYLDLAYEAPADQETDAAG